MGKTVIVTGASSGVGLAMARALAEHGADVIMVCRDALRGAEASNAVAASATGRGPTLLLADLSSQAAVRALAEDIRSRCKRIDVLINNAGAVFRRRKLSVDGIEKTFATNHLAPFLLTTLLLDRIRAAPAGRIVTVASESHGKSLDFDNLQLEHGYHFLKAYFLSKLGNILFTYELARRLRGTTVTANCCSPGPTLTGFGRDAGGLLSLMRAMMAAAAFVGLANVPEEGAQTPLQLAWSPGLATTTGRFYLGGRERRTNAITYDEAVAARLWSVSNSLVESVR